MKFNQGRFRTVACLCLCLLSIFLVAAHAQNASDVISELKVQIANKQYEAAFQKAQPLTHQFAGIPEFDYLLGISALHTRHLPVALFAFERVLIVEPDHVEAQFYLAKVYYELEKYELTQETLLKLIAQKVPHAFEAQIQALLEQAKKAYVKRWAKKRYFVATSVGYDSNINEAADTKSFSVPFTIPPDTLSIPLPLPVEARAQSDDFIKAGLWGDWIYPKNQKQLFYLRGSLSHQENLGNKTFDKTNYYLQGGTVLNLPKGSLTFPLTMEYLYFDDYPFRFLSTLGVEYAHFPIKRYKLSYFLEGGVIRFHRDSERNVDLITAGLKEIHQWPKTRMRFLNTLYYGVQSARHHGDHYLGNRYGGIQNQTEWALTSQHSLLASLSFQKRLFHHDHPIFEIRRRDLVYAFSLGWDWQLKRDLTFIMSYSYKRNDSNILLFDTDRNFLEVGIRYQLG